MQTVTATAISLGAGCEAEECLAVSSPLLLQLTKGNYDVCSVLAMPRRVGEWREEHRTARKRANRSANLGYQFATIDRARHIDDVYRINLSMRERQGRPMSAPYRRRPDFSPLPDYVCDLHRVSTYGVTKSGHLVAYLWLYRAGDLALVSSILGHGDHLASDVMYLLMQGTIGCEAETGGFLVYNRHDSGTDGLRYFKERTGFVETHVEWLP